MKRMEFTNGVVVGLALAIIAWFLSNVLRGVLSASVVSGGGKGREVAIQSDKGGGKAVSVTSEVNSEDMLPYVCAACGRNYDYTHSAPDECPHCGGEMIETE